MFNRGKVKALKAEICAQTDIIRHMDKVIGDLKHDADSIKHYYETLLLDKNEQIRLQELRIEVLTRTSEIKKEKVKEPKLVGKDLKSGKFISASVRK